MPGYTHLQRAQPVTVGHHLLAWVEMLERDRERFRFAAARRAAPSRSGAGALAGSTLRPPLRRTAAMRNSLDAVADRDFALDYLYACAALLLAPLADRRGARALGVGRVRLRAAARGGGDGVVDDAAEAEPGRGRARARQGRDRDRAAGRAARGREGHAARLRPRPPGGQAAGLRGAARRPRRLPRWPRSSAGITFDRERLARRRGRPAAARDRRGGARSSRDGVPFRDAHEQVAAQVRDGSFTGVEAAPRAAPGPGGVHEALAAARMRLGARPVS